MSIVNERTSNTCTIPLLRLCAYGFIFISCILSVAGDDTPQIQRLLNAENRSDGSKGNVSNLSNIVSERELPVSKGSTENSGLVNTAKNINIPPSNKSSNPKDVTVEAQQLSSEENTPSLPYDPSDMMSDTMTGVHSSKGRKGVSQEPPLDTNVGVEVSNDSSQNKTLNCSTEGRTEKNHSCNNDLPFVNSSNASNTSVPSITTETVTPSEKAIINQSVEKSTINTIIKGQAELVTEEIHKPTSTRYDSEQADHSASSSHPEREPVNVAVSSNTSNNVKEQVESITPETRKPTFTRDDSDEAEHLATSSYPESRYIIPIVATILTVPLLIVLVMVLYKRGKEFWERRHYRRMDFLIDGMYNE